MLATLGLRQRIERRAAQPTDSRSYETRLKNDVRGLRITPQFSGRALPCEARRERIMKWSARGVAAMRCDGPLQLLVRRLTQRLLALTCAPSEYLLVSESLVNVV